MRSVLFVVAACIVVNAWSQDQSNGILTRLPFEDAVKIALQNNVNLNTQKNNMYVANARKLQAYSGYLPGITGQAFAQRANGLQIDPTTGVGSNVQADNIQGSLNANYTVFNGFNRYNTIKQANNNLLAQTALVQRTNQDVIFNVASQYLTVLLDQQLLAIAEENAKTQRVIFDQMKAQVDLGARAQADEYTQNSLTKNAEVAAMRAKMTLENDRSLLAQTLQLDPSTAFEVVMPTWETDLNYFETHSLDSLYNIAINNRADIKQQNYLADGWKYSMRANSSGYYPTLALFTSYGSTYFASDAYKKTGGTPPLDFKDQFVNNNPQFAYGLQLNIPIFDRFQTRTNRIVSKISYQNTELIRDNLYKTAKIDVQRSFKNYQTAIESYRASLSQVEAGELAFRVQKESYDLGVASQVALATANQAYVTAISSKAQAEVTLLFQKILLEYALGTLKLEDFQ